MQKEEHMKIQLIRNATMKITYAGHSILTDPMLSAVGAFRSFAGIAANPTVELPVAVERILQDVEFTLISHLHPDHFDEAAAQVLPKNMPIFCQPEDKVNLQEKGFTNVTKIDTSCSWLGISITRTGGQHGSGKILEHLGNVSGFVLKAAGAPTVYWVGDSIWYEHVAAAIATHQPDIIITHSGGATLPGHAPIIMDGAQTLTTLEAAPQAVVVAIHMESLDHCSISRTMLRRLADGAGIMPARLMIPEDGATLVF
jgi:L-ascorbate metabolism protein UlaG (beta-lactamase superfamily)